MTKYNKTAQQKVAEAVHEMKQGRLMSGKSERKVTSRDQAVAIGLSKARREGVKVPQKRL